MNKNKWQKFVDFSFRILHFILWYAVRTTFTQCHDRALTTIDMSLSVCVRFCLCLTWANHSCMVRCTYALILSLKPIKYATHVSRLVSYVLNFSINHLLWFYILSVLDVQQYATLYDIPHSHSFKVTLHSSSSPVVVVRVSSWMYACHSRWMQSQSMRKTLQFCMQYDCSRTQADEDPRRSVLFKRFGHYCCSDLNQNKLFFDLLGNLKLFTVERLLWPSSHPMRCNRIGQLMNIDWKIIKSQSVSLIATRASTVSLSLFSSTENEMPNQPSWCVMGIT